uniref:Uncharacterized protein n=1 Tax=Odontella aurita TaxID=265563 RepID=A0A7S4N647_9STRA|mmetsp:Transcript_48508/g.146330  ORF Transcript_48508/g.146330 Transcript_48508/m.146330 type:complete len:209 (+) Transcript_48508:227-853(+)
MFLRRAALRVGRQYGLVARIHRPDSSLIAGRRSDIPARSESSSSSPPPANGSAFAHYTLNVDGALMKDSEGRPFSDILADDVSVIQGIGPNARSAMEALGIRTVEDLATYNYFLISRSIATLAETEKAEPGGRPEASEMNVDRAVDKPYRAKTFSEITDAPVAALYGLSEEKGAMMAETMGVKTVGDLAKLKYCRWAESIFLLSKYEK